MTRILEGRYELIEPLGRGGMGAVWRARHLALGKNVAVKLLNADLAASRDACKRFRVEAQTAAALASPHLAQVIDFGIDADSPYLVMELLEGETLAQLLARQGSLSPQRTAQLLSQAAKGLAWAHECGTVHRDFKPDNLFIANSAGEEVVKLLDFGVAKVLPELSISRPDTRTGDMLGTPYYMSPEQASGRGVVDHRADIWAFGVTAYQCLVGTLPFRANTLGGLVIAICSEPAPLPSTFMDVPPGFDEWFARCVERDPEGRYQSVTEMVAVLVQLCGGRALEAPKRACLDDAKPKFAEASSPNEGRAYPERVSNADETKLGTSTVDGTHQSRGKDKLGLSVAMSSSLASAFQASSKGRTKSGRSLLTVTATGAGALLLVVAIANYSTVTAKSGAREDSDRSAGLVALPLPSPNLHEVALASSRSATVPAPSVVHTSTAAAASTARSASTQAALPQRGKTPERRKLGPETPASRAAGGMGGTVNRAGF